MWLESIQRVIDYIEDHLEEPLDLNVLTNVAQIQAYPLQRTFSLLAMMTLPEYIRGRRLTLAAQQLTQTDEKIIDLALRFGYETPEAFTKAFKRQHGCSPTLMRNERRRVHAYNRLSIQVTLKGLDQMDYQLIERPALQISGWRKHFPTQDGAQQQLIPLFWNDVNHSGQGATLFKQNDGQIDGVIGVCSNFTEASMDYWIATTTTEVLPGQETMTIPASLWATFPVVGPMPHAIQEMWQRIYQEWLPSHGYDPLPHAELEVYSAGDPSAADYQSAIWIPVRPRD